mgnify:CR=1 FL=1
MTVQFLAVLALVLLLAWLSAIDGSRRGGIE